jgi:hypothetical protein
MLLLHGVEGMLVGGVEGTDSDSGGAVSICGKGTVPEVEGAAATPIGEHKEEAKDINTYPPSSSDVKPVRLHSSAT